MISSPALRLSGAYIAFLIGSGFATGQEAMQYFVSHGWWGIAGIAVCSVLMVYTCWSLLRAGRRAELATPEAAFIYFCGPYVGRFLAWYTIVLILAVAGVMFAGAAATLQQAFDVPTALGAGAMAVVVLLTMLLGLDRLLNILGVLGPVIILITLIVAVLALFAGYQDAGAGLQVAPELPLLRASNNWFFASLLYVGLALPGLASFLPLASKVLDSDRDVKVVALLGPCLLFSVLLLVCFALASQLPQIAQAQVPIMVLAGQLPGVGEVFAGIIFLGIFTTVTPLLWSVCRRFSAEATMRYRVLVIGLSLVGWLGGSLLPFDQLLNWIYPTVGYAGLLLLVCLLYTDIFRNPKR